LVEALVTEASRQGGIQRTTTTASPESDDIIALVQKHLSSTQSRPSPHKSGTAVQVFALPVFGKSHDALVTGGPHIVWQWIKPSSPYRKRGWWELTLEEVLTDGEWSAGKGIQLLVGGVSDEVHESMKRGEVKPFVLRDGQ
jgi:hypothetical protein